MLNFFFLLHLTNWIGRSDDFKNILNSKHSYLSMWPTTCAYIYIYIQISPLSLHMHVLCIRDVGGDIVSYN